MRARPAGPAAGARIDVGDERRHGQRAVPRDREGPSPLSHRHRCGPVLVTTLRNTSGAKLNLALARSRSNTSSADPALPGSFAALSARPDRRLGRRNRRRSPADSPRAQRPGRAAAAVRRRAPTRRLARAHQPRLLRAQNRALLYGPFPHGGLTRGVSDGTLLMSADAAVRELALTRIRATGASVVRIPVDWRYIVSANPPSGFDAATLRPAYASRGSTPPCETPSPPGSNRCWWCPARRTSRKLPTAGPTPTLAAGRPTRPRSKNSPPPRAPLRRLVPRSAAAPGACSRACGCCRPGTSPTSLATSSRSGSPRAGAGAPSRRCSTASC